MSQIEAVIKLTKYVEHQLRTLYGAEGTGMRELMESVDGRLPKDIKQKLRYIGTVRNALAHEYGVDTVPSPERFNQVLEEVYAFFGKRAEEAERVPEPFGYSIIFRLLHLFGISKRRFCRLMIWPRHALVAVSFLLPLILLPTFGSAADPIFAEHFSTGLGALFTLAFLLCSFGFAYTVKRLLRDDLLLAYVAMVDIAIWLACAYGVALVVHRLLLFAGLGVA